MPRVGPGSKGGEADRLLSECLGLILDCEFQEIWSEVLCRHPTVIGPPIRHELGFCSEIRVPLANGDSLAFDLGARMVMLRGPRWRRERVRSESPA
jgi:hypothetical protein